MSSPGAYERVAAAIRAGLRPSSIDWDHLTEDELLALDHVKSRAEAKRERQELQERLDFEESHRLLSLTILIPYYGRARVAESVEQLVARALYYRIGERVEIYRTLPGQVVLGDQIEFNAVKDDGNEPDQVGRPHTELISWRPPEPTPPVMRGWMREPGRPMSPQHNARYIALDHEQKWLYVHDHWEAVDEWPEELPAASRDTAHRDGGSNT